jgi:capsular polysaccharide biosynthesis protein
MQFRVGRLHVYKDYALNASKRQRLQTLARRLKVHFPSAPCAPRSIYLRRGGSGVSRLVAEEETLITALQGSGFAVVDVEGIALADLMAALSGAEIVISIEGSHINHALFAMAEGGVLLVLNPADRFNAFHLANAAAFGLQPATLVMQRVEGGYGADPAEVLDTLALAQGPHTAV